MPVLKDFCLASYEDGLLRIDMAPAISIGGWTLEYQQSLRFGGDPAFVKSVASGYSNASGIAVIGSGQGSFVVSLFAADMSGKADGAYSYRILRTDSGNATAISEGFRLCPP